MKWMTLSGASCTGRCVGRGRILLLNLTLQGTNITYATWGKFGKSSTQQCLWVRDMLVPRRVLRVQISDFVLVSTICFWLPMHPPTWCFTARIQTFGYHLPVNFIGLILVAGTWHQLMVSWGSPYERDCCLGAPLESQTTNPNHRFTSSWWQHINSYFRSSISKPPTIWVAE